MKDMLSMEQILSMARVSMFRLAMIPRCMKAGGIMAKKMYTVELFGQTAICMTVNGVAAKSMEKQYITIQMEESKMKPAKTVWRNEKGQRAVIAISTKDKISSYQCNGASVLSSKL